MMKDAKSDVCSLAGAGETGQPVQKPDIVLENLSEDLEATLQLGYAWISRGSLDTAREVFEGLTRLPLESGDAQQVGCGLIRIGDVLMDLADHPGAMVAYRAALEIRQALMQRDPDNTQWQLAVVNSQGHVGDALEGLGKSRTARAAYRAGLEIAEALARQDCPSTQSHLDIAYLCAKLAISDCLMTTKQRRQYLTQGREALVSLQSREPLAEMEEWIEHFDIALKLASWNLWNAARKGLKIIGIGLLAIHILQSPFIVEPGWVAIHLAIAFGVGLVFGVVLCLVDDRALGAEQTDIQEVNQRIIAEVRRHPIRLALLLPGEDGFFFVPLLWVGITPVTAGMASAAFAAFHYPEFPIITCVPKFVILYAVAMVVLPHGIGSVVVGHLLADAVGLLLMWLSGDDGSARRPGR